MRVKLNAEHRANATWRMVLRTLIEKGERIVSAGRATRELLGAGTVVNALHPVVWEPRRKMGWRFMAAEAAWILSGDDKVSTIAPYSKAISKFSDDGATFFGAYGPKIVGQWESVLADLARDPCTRRAVINIWRENPPVTKDYPCTTNLQFLLRQGELNLHVTMRSSDIWLGWVYDTFTQACILHAMVADLRTRHGIYVNPGYVQLTAGSLHLYEDDVPKALYVLDDQGADGLQNDSDMQLDQTTFELFPNTTKETFVTQLWDLANASEDTPPLGYDIELFSVLADKILNRETATRKASTDAVAARAYVQP